MLGVGQHLEKVSSNCVDRQQRSRRVHEDKIRP